jgi:hypothetical protein
MKMNASRTYTILSLLAASIAAGALVASVVRGAAPAAPATAQVSVSMQQTAAGEQVPTVTVVARRMNAQQKAHAAMLDVKQAAHASLAGIGKALAAAHRA